MIIPRFPDIFPCHSVAQEQSVSGDVANLLIIHLASQGAQENGQLLRNFDFPTGKSYSNFPYDSPLRESATSLLQQTREM